MSSPRQSSGNNRLDSKIPKVRLHHLSRSSFDDKPLWLVSDDAHAHFYQAHNPFRFEAMWLKYDRCEELIHLTWDISLGGDLVCKVMKKVSDCQIQLKLWNKNTFGNVCIALA